MRRRTRGSGRTTEPDRRPGGPRRGRDAGGGGGGCAGGCAGPRAARRRGACGGRAAEPRRRAPRGGRPHRRALPRPARARAAGPRRIRSRRDSLGPARARAAGPLVPMPAGTAPRWQCPRRPARHKAGGCVVLGPRGAVMASGAVNAANAVTRTFHTVRPRRSLSSQHAPTPNAIRVRTGRMDSRLRGNDGNKSVDDLSADVMTFPRMPRTANVAGSPDRRPGAWPRQGSRPPRRTATSVAIRLQ